LEQYYQSIGETMIRCLHHERTTWRMN